MSILGFERCRIHIRLKDSYYLFFQSLLLEQASVIDVMERRVWIRANFFGHDSGYG